MFAGARALVRERERGLMRLTVIEVVFPRRVGAPAEEGERSCVASYGTSQPWTRGRATMRI